MPVVLHRHHDVEAGGAHLGDAALQLGIEHFDDAAPFGVAVGPGQTEVAKEFAEPLEPAQIFVPVVFGKLDEQNGFRIAAQKGVDNRPEHGDVAGEASMVRSINRRRSVRAPRYARRLHRLVEAAEMAGAERAAAELRRKFQFDFSGKRQRAFGADEEMRQIDVVSPRHQCIEIVAADAALHFRKAPFDFIRLARRDRQQIASQRLRHICRRIAQAAEMRAAAVSQRRIDGDNILAGVAVAQRARAAGIVAHHAADGGA